MAAAEGMSTGEGDDFLVIESVESKVRWFNGFNNSRGRTPYDKKSVENGVDIIRYGEGKDDTHGAEVVMSLACIRETTVRGCILGKAIYATRAPWDLGSAHFLFVDELLEIPSKLETDLDGSDTTESPEVAIAYPLELFLYLFHDATSNVEAVVGTMRGFGLEAHGRIVAVFEVQKQPKNRG